MILVGYGNIAQQSRQAYLGDLFEYGIRIPRTSYRTRVIFIGNITQVAQSGLNRAFEGCLGRIGWEIGVSG